MVSTDFRSHIPLLLRWSCLAGRRLLRGLAWRMMGTGLGCLDSEAAVWLWGREGWLCTQMATTTTGSEKEVVTFCVTLCAITFKIFLRNGPQALSITL